jgi:hypothetical protein
VESHSQGVKLPVKPVSSGVRTYRYASIQGPSLPWPPKGLCSVEEDDSGDELNGGEEVSGELVVAG